MFLASHPLLQYFANSLEIFQNFILHKININVNLASKTFIMLLNAYEIAAVALACACHVVSDKYFSTFSIFKWSFKVYYLFVEAFFFFNYKLIGLMEKKRQLINSHRQRFHLADSENALGIEHILPTDSLLKFFYAYNCNDQTYFRHYHMISPYIL